MTALRSRRLEALFGAPVDQLTADNIMRLVDNDISEEFDLDFKAELYGRGDSDRRSLAGDVCALANTAGGIIVLGVAEDDQARAVAARGIDLADAEVSRMRQIVGSLAAPMPVFEVYCVPSPDSGPSRGYYVLAVPRSPNAPHAVIVNDALRYPRRNGSTTRYLSESEVAAAYRDRQAGAGQQVSRITDITTEAARRLDRSEPWLLVSLVPDLSGDMLVTQEVFAAFQRSIIGRNVTVVPSGITFQRANVGHRRLLADGGTDSEYPLAKWASLELHTDGSGVSAIRVASLSGADRDLSDPLLVDDESIALCLVSGLLDLAIHARDNAAAGGNVLVRTQLIAESNPQLTGIGHTRQFGTPQRRSRWFPVEWPIPAETAAQLDDLAQPGPTLVATAARLLDELGQGFAIPEMGQLSRDGSIRKRYWGQTWNRALTGWAELHGVVVTDEILA